MTEVIVNKFKNYRQYKTELDSELGKEAEGFVRIGYLLKVARDTNILQESGYANVVEFAKAEYNIDKTLVSRFIRINDRFSEYGNSERLRSEYLMHGYSKLSLMLSLPEEITEELSSNFSKADIQAVKEEYEAEQEITDIEVLMEGEAAGQKELTLLEKVIHQIGYRLPTLYKDVYDSGTEISALKEVLAPSGEDIYTIRVQGIGGMTLSVKENSETVSVINMRSAEKEYHTWDELAAEWKKLLPDAENAKRAWEMTYGDTWKEPEEKAKVAPVQQGGSAASGPRKEKVKPAKKKPKVIKVPKAEKKEAENKQEKMPESRKNAECEGKITKEEFEKRYGEMGDIIDIIQEAYSKAEFGRISEEAKSLVELAEKMKDVEVPKGEEDGEE